MPFSVSLSLHLSTPSPPSPSTTFKCLAAISVAPLTSPFACTTSGRAKQRLSSSMYGVNALQEHFFFLLFYSPLPCLLLSSTLSCLS